MPAEPSPRDALVHAAREHAAGRLGRARLPVAVVIHFDAALELESVRVELTAPAADAEGRVSACLRDVIVVLARAGCRLTTTQIQSGLDKAGSPWGDTTLKLGLAEAVRNEILDNRSDVKPGGYGLPGW